ncbi:hypothetical protein ACFSR2_02310 [Emticicia soli]|uniref:T9SS C-terminal target domain-containing protein n=2 Tax=Emticicia soli TaxID=2027878 RepID=A0ABW5J1R5_9BACT
MKKVYILLIAGLLLFSTQTMAQVSQVAPTESVKQAEKPQIEKKRSVSGINVSGYNAFHEIAGSEDYDSKVHLLIKETSFGFPRIRFMNTIYSTPGNNRFWDLTADVYDANSNNDYYSIKYGSSANASLSLSPTGKAGIGIDAPSAVLDVLGQGNWDLASGSTGDFRVGSEANNFRIGVATGGGGAGDVRLYGKRLIFGTGTADRMTITNDGVGINWQTPNSRLDVYQTGLNVAAWGGYTRNLRASAMFNGTHAILNDPYDAIGVASHGNWASSGFNNIGVLGTAGNTGYDNVGVQGYVNENSVSSNYLFGMRALALQAGTGNTYGLYASASGVGTATRYGIYATVSGTGTSYAGYFNGNVYVSGTLAKSAGTFKIDHPLDPENKYLSHSFVESPDMMNVYNGNTTTDNAGNATISLPAYFEALNKDFRYQLTVIGGEFGQAIVSSEVKNNQFGIKTDKPNLKVSWQVTGIRQDAYANANRVVPETEKAKDEKGKYLNPEVFKQSKSANIHYINENRVVD